MCVYMCFVCLFLFFYSGLETPQSPITMQTGQLGDDKKAKEERMSWQGRLNSCGCVCSFSSTPLSVRLHGAAKTIMEQSTG